MVQYGIAVNGSLCNNSHDGVLLFGNPTLADEYIRYILPEPTGAEVVKLTIDAPL